MSTKSFVFILLCFTLLLAACGGGEPNAIPEDPAELNSYHFSQVCQDTVIPIAAEYDSDSDDIHPIVFYNNFYAEDNYNLIFDSEMDMDSDWTVEVDGDYSVIELVGCVSRIDSELFDTCEYEFDDSNDVGVLEMYDATYELRLIAAQTGELLLTETIETYMDECPSFTMFSDADEVEQRYGRPHDQLPTLVEPYVAP